MGQVLEARKDVEQQQEQQQQEPYVRVIDD